MRRVRGMWVGGAVAMAVAVTLAAMAWNYSGCGSMGHRLAGLATPGAAFAEEVLEFKPLSPESAAAIDRRTSDKIQRLTERARRQAEIDAKAQGVPAPSSIPAVPSVPSVPEPPAGRSGDIMRLGSDIEIEKGQTVDGDVVSIGGDVEIFGHVRGDAASMGGDLHLGPEARVDGDVVCIGGNLEEEPGSSVGGQRVTALGVMRGGASKRIIIDRDHDDGHRFADRAVEHATKVFTTLVVLLILLGFAWIYLNFAAERSAVTFATAKRETGMSLLVGFVAALLLAPSAVALALVVAILCITIIGIPLGIAAVFAYAALLLVVLSWGYVIGASLLGERLGARGGSVPSLMRSAVIGIVAIQGTRAVAAMIGLIPFFGWVGGLLAFIAIVVGSLAILIGTGALIRSKLGQGPDGKWWPIRKRVVPVAPAGAPGVAPAPSPAPAPAPSATPPAAPYSSSPPASFAPEPPPAPPATEPEPPGPGSPV